MTNGDVPPAGRAALHYQKAGCPRLFKKHLTDALVNGYVAATPRVFAMCKAVALEDDRTAWYVTYASGDLRQLVAMIPFPLPFIAFARLRNGQEKLRVYPFDRFLRLSEHVTRHTSHVTFPSHV